jgi:glutamate carboxypeptidase
VGIFDIMVTGRAAHAGNDPQNGVSAVEELAHQVLLLHGLTDYGAGTTINVGVVQGGTVRNQIAPQAWALVDVRVPTAQEGQRVGDFIMGLTPVHPEATLEITGGMNRQPLERTPEIVAMFNGASNLAIPLGMELQEASVGGGSDAQFVAAVGTPVLDGLGGVGEGPHAEGEYVFLDSLTQRTALLASLLMDL